MKNRVFKDVTVTFKMKGIPRCDQMYLRDMFYETVNSKDWLHLGMPFDEKFKTASNFTLFNDEQVMEDYMSEFALPYSSTASHLLHGKKYWMAWTYEPINVLQ